MTAISDTRNSVRDTEIDFCKGVLIWLVVFGHTIQYVLFDREGNSIGDPLFTIIYMFHMPAFMILSGYLLTNFASISQYHFLTKRIKNIILPMAIWCAVITFFQISLGFGNYQYNITDIFQIFLFNYIHEYWFLWVNLLSTILVVLIRMMPINYYVAGSLISGVLLTMPFSRLPVQGGPLSFLPFLFPFYYVGTVGLPIFGARSKMCLWMFAVTGIASVIFFFSWQSLNFVYINHSDIFKYPLPVANMLIGGMIASAFILSILWQISIRYDDNIVVKFFVLCGSLTLPIYLGQELYFRILQKMQTAIVQYFPYWMAITICVFVTCLIISSIIAILRLWPGKGSYSLVWGARPALAGQFRFPLSHQLADESGTASKQMS